MERENLYFASDNWAPAHSSIMEAVLKVNEGYAPAYGSDSWTVKAQSLLQISFKRNCRVFFLPTGTGANVLGMAVSCRRYESVICSNISHINYQESGAAESLVGCKLVTMPHVNGKVTPSALMKVLSRERAFGKHSTSPRLLSIAQPTEVGTVYTVEELVALSQLCKEEGLLIHVDGSRLYNAAVSLGVGLDEAAQSECVDILSLGGTKNGLLGAEALVIFNEGLFEGSDHLQKQYLQLLSKMRYLSAQYLALFQGNLWNQLASQANQRAQEIAKVLESIPALSLSYPVETNQVFFTALPSWIPLIQEKVFCHLWDRDKNEIRMIASWNTSEDEIDSLRQIFLQLADEEY